MELTEQMTMITAAMLANPNCTKSVDDLVATAALIADEINAYEWVEDEPVPELPERGGGLDNPSVTNK